jgi:hypothetical protein
MGIYLKTKFAIDCMKRDLKKKKKCFNCKKKKKSMKDKMLRTWLISIVISMS